MTSATSVLDNVRLFKGHGTENDFVILPDPDGRFEITPSLVASLCNRYTGLGGDGLLRIVPSAAIRATDAVDATEDDESAANRAPETQSTWFMDYRNADGSPAEMCGNGARVFAHFLRAFGLEEADEFIIGTRAGDRTVTVHSADERHAEVSIGMGKVNVLGVSTCFLGKRAFAGLGVDVGNPHLACIIPGLTEEQLSHMPIPAGFTTDDEFFPEGVNVEIATELKDSAVTMRVNERGVGETRSCGTGTVAVATAALADAGLHEGEVTVNVPGGAVRVTLKDGFATLRGPSEIVYSARMSGNRNA